MVTDKANQPFGSSSIQDPAPAFSKNISPRSEAGRGTGEHADGGAEHVIRVQCQAIACGATLQVRVPLEYFSGNGDVLVHCGECKKLLKVQLPQGSFGGPTPTVVPPLVPTPTPAVDPPPASTAATALQDAGSAAGLAAISQVPACIPVLQNLPVPAVRSGATAFNDSPPTSCSTEVQQQKQCGPGAGSKAQASDESASASWKRQLAQLNKLAAGTRNTAPAMLMSSGPPISKQHPRQQHAGAAAQTHSSQLAPQQPQNHQVNRPPMGPPAARPPSIRPSAPVGPLAGHSAVHLHPSSHAAGSNASLGMSLGQQQTVAGSGAAAAVGLQQASPAGPALQWSDPAAGFTRRYQLQPAPGAVGSDMSAHIPAAAATVPPHPAGYHSSGGGEGCVEVHPVAAASHNVPVAVRFADLKQLTYQEVLEQATRATLNAPRSPVRNPYRALVQDQLQQDQLQQQYRQQRLRLQHFERSRAAMLDRPDHNRPGSGYGTDHMQYPDQYVRDVVIDTGIKRRLEPGAAALTQHELDILEQQQGKRVRHLQEPVHSAAAAKSAVHQLVRKEAARWSGDNPGNWNSRKAAALTDIEYMARETAAAQRHDMPPTAAAAALGLTPNAQQYGISRPRSAGGISHGVASMQRHEVAVSGAAAGGAGDDLPDHGVMPPPRHIMGASVGLHKLGSDAVNNALITATSTPTPTAAATAALACFLPGTAASAVLGPSPCSTGMVTVNNSRPQSLDESWRAVTSTQQAQRQYFLSEPAATTHEPAHRELSTCSNKAVQEAQGGTLKTMGSGGNYFTDMLRDAITPPPEDLNPAVPGLAATTNPSAATRASPKPPMEPAATAALHQSHQAPDVEASSPAGTPPPAATPAGAAPVASDRPTEHAAEPPPRAASASVTTISEGGPQHWTSQASQGSASSAAATAQDFSPLTVMSKCMLLPHLTPAAAVNAEGSDGRLTPPSLGPFGVSSMFIAADSPAVGGAVSGEGRQTGAARPAVNSSCDQSAQSSGDTRSRPQQQQPHVHQQQGVARAAGSGGANSHTTDAQDSPVAGGDRAASRIQFPSKAAAGLTTVTWGSSIDTTAEPSDLGLAHLTTTSLGPGFDTRSSTHPPESPVALLRRHNSAPVTTGVALVPRTNSTASAAVIITPGPLAAGGATGIGT